MNWTIIDNNEKLLLWKNLRNSLRLLNREDQLKKVAEFFSVFPYGSRSIDYYDPSSWPTPWEIIYHDSYCTSSISVLIYYTLLLSDPDIEIDLLLVEDEDGIYLLPRIENQYVLNYHLGEVNTFSTIESKFRIIEVFNKNQIRTIT